MQVQITRTLEGKGTFHILPASNKVQMAKASKLKLQRQKIIDLKRLTRHSNKKSRHISTDLHSQPLGGGGRRSKRVQSQPGLQGDPGFKKKSTTTT